MTDDRQNDRHRDTPPVPTGDRILNEGTVKKGGTNDAPSSPPPQNPPVGQGSED